MFASLRSLPEKNRSCWKFLLLIEVILQMTHIFSNDQCTYVLQYIQSSQCKRMGNRLKMDLGEWVLPDGEKCN